MSSARCLSILLLTLALAICVQHSALAQQACDSQFMDAVEARAFSEGAREAAMNQNLIFKPDSVLEYGCFDRLMDDVVSGSTFYMTNDELDRVAFGNAANSNPLMEYYTSNFSHPFLGGRLPPGGAGGGAFCNALAYVWNAGLCMNFYDQNGWDRFFDLAHFTANDPRHLPAGLTACPMPYAGVTIPIASAFNNQQANWTIPGPNPLDSNPYRGDPARMERRD